ncbi:MAG TPA: ABC transporter ATP-binding protein [Chloroflexota bacterium]
MLELKNVTAGYGTFKALFDIDMAVNAGETVGVIGPNGAGKTTLLRLISGVIHPMSGAITLNGQNISSRPAHEIVAAGVAHVPENRRLFPRLSVEENLKMGSFIPSARPQFAERLEWAYDVFPRLKERRNQLAQTLSGGEQQMCAIARALMSKPSILLMDEPSAGLAPVIVDQVFDLVERISKDGLTVLIVEQNIQSLLDVVERAYLLEVGTIKLQGSSAELRENPFVRKAYLGI